MFFATRYRIASIHIIFRHEFQANCVSVIDCGPFVYSSTGVGGGIFLANKGGDGRKTRKSTSRRVTQIVVPGVVG